MFDAIVELVPAEWRATVTVLLSPLRWIPELQATLLRPSMLGDGVAGIVLVSTTLLLPALLVIVGLWCTMLSLYTLPFRSGRGSYITALLLAWWDAGRCIWLFWMGFVRVAVALVGWIIGMIRFGWLFLKNLLVGMVRSPFSLLDWTTRRYFQPGVPWIAFLVLLLWTGVEATIFTFTLHPTLNEVFAGLTGFEPNPTVMIPLLWIFLFMLVAGSFACMQVLASAVRQRKVSDIVQMIIVESAVMFFEVIFLYREMIDAITPWIAQQTGGEVRLGLVATLALASFGWMGVRGMSWFLFGRFGTPALLAVIARQTITHDATSPSVPPPVHPTMWKAPIDALKAETAWFHQEAKRMLELLSLPVLQLLAGAVNFAVMIVQSHGVFALPFKSLEDMLQATHLARSHHAHVERPHRRSGVPTPRDPMPGVAS
ncbi:MAG: hypothetical protein M3125_02170 [Gemmatimonadota bacterium]|nr:hypothetical protein [Gemmatimonadota bacterium]